MNDDAFLGRQEEGQPLDLLAHPHPPNSTVAAQARSTSGGVGPGPPMLVWIGPGAMPVTRMPSGARSIAAWRTRLATAPFEAL